ILERSSGAAFCCALPFLDEFGLTQQRGNIRPSRSLTPLAQRLGRGEADRAEIAIGPRAPAWARIDFRAAANTAADKPVSVQLWSAHENLTSPLSNTAAAACTHS